MRNPPFRFVPWSLVFLVALGVPVAVSGQASDREAELEALRDEILGLRSRLARVRSESAGVRGKLTETRVALELQEKRVEEARAARALAEEQLSVLEAETASLATRLDELRTKLRRRLTDLYRLGRQGYLRLILSIRAERHLLPGIRQIRYLARRDHGLLETYLDTRARLSVRREEVEERRREVGAWLGREAERLEELSRLQRRQRSLLAGLESERRELASRTARLADKERKLTNLIDFLYGRSTAPLRGTPIQTFRGALDWPAPGRVAKGFGPRADPRYGTMVPHNGLELATAAGEPVRAIFPGRVLFAAPFEGYGLTVVVLHPGRVFTLYAGLRSLQVAQDAVLSLGDPVGASGGTLYFEVRVENRPVDPRDWLR